MRVCPNCGTYDAAIWRGMMYLRYTDYCHKSELESWDPELFKKIKETPRPAKYQDKHFRYSLTKAGYVHRIAKINLANASNPNSIDEPDMEKPKNRHHHEYHKLSEFATL